ncbi:hypothetical protein [Nitrospira sp. KM1]|uniref:hypothetical protein n=1 Tax=Nitrospira sp. KM1 TaxID=1936990 RepID=UPI001566465A|nr:hypothetical protein [Nitrospira sp. KM1]
MKSLITRLTLPCRRVTRLVAESGKTLAPLANAKFQAHLFLCEQCRLYATQLKAIRERQHLVSDKTEQTSQTRDVHERTKPSQHQSSQIGKTVSR